MVLSQLCLFMNPEVDFAIYTNSIKKTESRKFDVMSDDPEPVLVIDGNTIPEIIQSQGTRSR